MIKLRKISLFLILLSAFALFSGCQTMENIVVINTENGNNLYIRRTLLKTKDSEVKSVDFDVTVNADNSGILKNPVVNYTLQFPQNAYDKIDGISFFFENDGDKYFVTNQELLYKEIDGKKNLNTRYTSELSIEDMNKLASNFLPVKVGLQMSDGREILLSSDEVDDKFNDLRVILK